MKELSRVELYERIRRDRRDRQMSIRSLAGMIAVMSELVEHLARQHDLDADYAERADSPSRSKAA